MHHLYVHPYGTAPRHAELMHPYLGTWVTGAPTCFYGF